MLHQMEKNKNIFKEILEQYIFKNVSETVKWIAIKFSPNIHGYQMMNLNDFGDPDLSFSISLCLTILVLSEITIG